MPVCSAALRHAPRKSGRRVRSKPSEQPVTWRSSFRSGIIRFLPRLLAQTSVFVQRFTIRSRDQEAHFGLATPSHVSCSFRGFHHVHGQCGRDHLRRRTNVGKCREPFGTTPRFCHPPATCPGHFETSRTTCRSAILCPTIRSSDSQISENSGHGTWRRQRAATDDPHAQLRSD